MNMSYKKVPCCALKLFGMALIVMALSSCAHRQADNARNQEPGIVILKLDDLRFGSTDEHNSYGVRQGWQDVFEYLDTQQVAGSIGIIAEPAQRAHAQHIRYIQGLASTGHEVWNHGWDHKRAGLAGEFCEHPSDRQQRNFNDAQDTIRSVYGIQMRSLGTPYNCSDKTFTAIFEAQQLIKVFMFADEPKPRNAMNLERWVDIELRTGEPNFEYFLEKYQANLNRKYYVLQGHPRDWTKGSPQLAEFEKIIEFLKSKGHRFMTPYDYYLHVNGKLDS